MSRETNVTSLRKAFQRPFAEKHLLGYAFLQAGVLLLVGLLFYAVAVRVLMTQFTLPIETFMELFANNGLPPDVELFVSVMTGVFAVLLSVIAVYFEAGLFGVISSKKNFWRLANRAFWSFIVVVVGFELIEVASLVVHLPTRLLPWWLYVGAALFFLIQLFLMVWQVLAQFSAVKQGPIQSFKESWFLLVRNLGHWGRSFFTFVVLFILYLIIGLVLIIVSALHPISLVLVSLLLVVSFIYVALVMRIFFFNRIRVLRK